MGTKKLLAITTTALAALLCATSGLSIYYGLQSNQTVVGPAGETGPQGETGATGATGATGETGPQGPQGIQGIQGEKGEDGTSLLTGFVDPTSDLGNEGDSYLNLTTYDYFVKREGIWIRLGNLLGDKGETGLKGDQGDPGKDGYSLITGQGVPSDDEGNDGDSYINLLNWDFYTKENGSWQQKGNIKGDLATYPQTYSVRIVPPVTQSLYYYDYSSVQLYAEVIDDLTGLEVPSASLTWSSQDPSVVSISSAGLLKSEGEGTTRVTATYVVGDKEYKGHMMFEVYSVNVLHTYDIVHDDLTYIDINQSYNLNAKIVDTNINEEVSGTITYTSNNPLTAKVDASTGVVEGLQSGPVTITATATFHGKTITKQIPIIVDQAYTRGLVFQRVGDAYHVTGYTGTDSTDSLIIPTSHRGLPVTTISSYIFGTGTAGASSSITTITLPASITTIEANAFYYCSNLKNIIISADSQLESIGNAAFRYCNSLESITLPETLKTIGDNAFADCTALKDVNFPVSLESIGRTAFQRCAIPSLDLSQNTNLKTIGSFAFDRCSNLTEVTLPSSLETLGSYALANNPALTTVNFPDDCKLTQLSQAVFAYNESLNNIEIPNSIKVFGEGVFRACTSLTDITFEAGSALTELGNSCFSQCKALKKIEVPTTVTKIGQYAFWKCDSLSSFNFNDSGNLKEIGQYAFSQCPKLTNIYIDASVETIGRAAFQWLASSTYLKKTIYYEGSSKPNGFSDNWAILGDSYCVAYKNQTFAAYQAQEPISPETNEITSARNF